MKKTKSDPTVTLNEPFHLFITFGDKFEQRTHLGGFPTKTETTIQAKWLTRRAETLLGKGKFKFATEPGPVTLKVHEQAYGGPWDKR